MAQINSHSLNASWEITWTDNLSWIIVHRIYSFSGLRGLKGCWLSEILEWWEIWYFGERVYEIKRYWYKYLYIHLILYLFNSSLYPWLQWKKSTAQCKYCNFNIYEHYTHFFLLMNRFIFVIKPVTACCTTQ